MAQRQPSGNWTCGYHVRTDLRGDGISGGVRSAGVSAVGGLIRRWELDSGIIRHTVAVALPREHQRVGWVWPATSEDGGSNGSYLGTIPMGSLFAIPPSVDVTTLGLSSGGLILAHALQDYGAYDVDSSSSVVFYTEPSADDSSVLAQMRRDVAKILGHLRVVTNNSQRRPGGGGIPRQASAPPLATL